MIDRKSLFALFSILHPPQDNGVAGRLKLPPNCAYLVAYYVGTLLIQSLVYPA